MYWDIGTILPFQRHWNFINGPREIGKTYTTLKWLIKQAIYKNKNFIYICRTQDEKKNNVLWYACQKVLENEYPEFTFKSDGFTLFVVHQNDDGKVLSSKEIAKCIAISEYVKIKKYSFVGYNYLIFDEYMLEQDSSARYVKGWKEPDFLLSIYQTIDRGEDSLICFLLGNNTFFYNPYHMHPAFNIPKIMPGQIWKSDNVLFQWCLPSAELVKKLSKNKIIKQITGTSYGNYAFEGCYAENDDYFISSLTKKSIYQFTVTYDNEKYGVYMDASLGNVIISQKIDPSCKFNYTFSISSHTPDTIIVNKQNFQMKWLTMYFKQGRVKFENMKIKTKALEWIHQII